MKLITPEQLLKNLAQVFSLKRAQQTEALDKIQVKSANREHICIRHNDNLELIPIEDIYYFQANQEFVNVHCKEGTVIIEESLVSLENDLSEHFIRIHRNALVAKKCISSLSKSPIGRVKITIDKTADELEVSRRHVAEIRRFVSSKGDSALRRSGQK